MVRFENLLYERLLNTKLLGRARTFASPRKWYNEPRHEAVKVMAYKLFKRSFVAPILNFLEPIYAKYYYQWTRDILLQRGLSFEDIYVHTDRDMRRCYFFETVARQNLHPYQFIFFKRRRARFYKVERGLRGCWVPEYIRQEAESRLLGDTAQNVDEWESFIYENYISDMTPCTRPTIIPRLIPLEMFNHYKLFNNDAWDRYFFDEVNYTSHTEKERKEAANMGLKVQVNDPTSRKNFEDYVNRLIRLYPGAVVREGEKFDFEGFYAKLNANKNKAVAQNNKWLKLRQDLIAQVEDKKGKKEKKKIGTVLPTSFGRSFRKSLFLN